MGKALLLASAERRRERQSLLVHALLHFPPYHAAAVWRWCPLRPQRVAGSARGYGPCFSASCEVHNLLCYLIIKQILMLDDHSAWTVCVAASFGGT